MPPTRLAFIKGFCSAVMLISLLALLLIPQYGNYMQRSEIRQIIATAEPLQNAVADKLKNKQPPVGIPPHPQAATRISADGWILLTTPRYGRQILPIPSRQANGEIAWEQHFEHGELR